MIASMLQQPLIRIECAGSALTPALAAALTSAVVVQALSAPAMAEISFAGAAVNADECAKFFGNGSELCVTIQGDTLFCGKVTAMEFSLRPDLMPEFRVRASDALQALRQSQQLKAFVDMDLRGLASELCPELTVSGASGEVWPHLLQYGQTDFALLEKVVRHAGLYFTLRGSDLLLLDLQGDGEPEATLKVGKNVREMRLTADSNAVWSGVSTSGWNPQSAQIFTGDSAAFSGGSGVAVGQDAARKFTGRTLPSEPHATALAQAEMNRRTAMNVHLHAVVDGDVTLTPGRRVTLEGVGSQWTSGFTLTRVRHFIDSQHGYISDVQTRPEEVVDVRENELSLTLPAVVVQVEDPEQLGRVKVMFPTCGEIESDWLPVVLPGLGKDKGLVALPDTDDRVLVLCPGGDPSLGLVLGGLPDPENPPDAPTHSAGAAHYLFRTSTGQELKLDRKNGKVSLSNQAAGKLEITRSGTHLHSGGDLLMDAPGHTITIRAQAIRFEQA